ncbi:VOC family protein [Corynebacterium pacaense]|uniref:VOC family protein n=1 Tax=Corynebacterium pacaense TaxID=1816684 RepID=UPI0009BB5E6D|nr:VOC family protein [Corynebacterium pacaense]
MSSHLDHIVIAGPDLNELVSRFSELTGITPVPGGRHETGSANALVPLADPPGSYIELIAPDPEAAQLSSDHFALASTGASEPRVAAWCIRPDSLDELAVQYRELGIEPDGIGEMNRHTPDGAVLSWRLIRSAPGVDYSPLPFAIDWGNTAHPSGGETPLASVEKLIIHGGAAALEALSADFSDDLTAIIELADGDPFLELTLNTPKGLVGIGDI